MSPEYFILHYNKHRMKGRKHADLSAGDPTLDNKANDVFALGSTIANVVGGSVWYDQGPDAFIELQGSDDKKIWKYPFDVFDFQHEKWLDPTPAENKQKYDHHEQLFDEFAKV